MLAIVLRTGILAGLIAGLAVSAAAFRTNDANPFYRLPMTFAEIFPVGVLVSLVSAALLRNPRVLAAPRD